MSNPLVDTWAALAPVQTNIYGLVFSLLGAWIIATFRARVKLIFGRANNSLNHIRTPDPDNETNHRQIEVYVEKFFLQNVGKKPATNVDFILSAEPGNISVFEPRDTTMKRLISGEFLVSIPTIAPQELVVIDCIYVNQLASRVVSVKCAEAMGRQVEFFTVRKFRPAFYQAMLALMVFGAAFVVQFAIALLAGV